MRILVGFLIVFQSPDGDSVVSHNGQPKLVRMPASIRFSPLTGIPWFPTLGEAGPCEPAAQMFQSPDGDSVVSH